MKNVCGYMMPDEQVDAFERAREHLKRKPDHVRQVIRDNMFGQLAVTVKVLAGALYEPDEKKRKELAAYATCLFLTALAFEDFDVTKEMLKIAMSMSALDGETEGKEDS